VNAVGHGDMALAYCIHYIESRGLAKITNYGEFLEKFPPQYEAQIFENSSWSCVHGVERWRSNCGCNSGGRPGWNQSWRAPLRQALDWLREELITVFEKETKPYLAKPWKARDGYIDVILNRTRKRTENFLAAHAKRPLTKDEAVKVIKLMEMQRHAMLMYTSCGWFFDEISGIETVQVMQYASRAIQLAEEISSVRLEQKFIEKLAAAQSNDPEYGDGARIYETYIKPSRQDLLTAGVHYAIASLFEEYPESLPIYSYLFRSEVYDRVEAGIQKLVIGMSKVISSITWEESLISFAVLYLGQHTVIASAQENMTDEDFSLMHSQIKKAFARSEIAEVIHLMEVHFKSRRYSLFQLSKDQQRRVINQIMQTTLSDIENSFRNIYVHNYHMMNLMNNAQAPLPPVFKTTVEVILNADVRRVFEEEHLNLDELQRLADEVERWQVKLDTETVGYAVIKKLNSLMKQFVANPMNTERLRYINEVFRLVKTLPLQPDVWMVQNMYFSVGDKYFKQMQEAANRGESISQKWVKYFAELGDKLEVSIR
jgi:alpha-amylase/alpha-mannosidase (GH57 family)